MEQVIRRLDSQAKRRRDVVDFTPSVDREPLYFSRAWQEGT